MAVQYVNYQDNKKGGTKLFYGRAVHPSTINLETVADRIQSRCSMTKGDCLAVLTEMVTVMKDELQNSNKICLDGLGTFWLSISTSGSVSEETFDINKNLRCVKVKFLAEGHKQNGVMTRTFTDGVKVQKAAGYSSSTQTT